MVSLPDASSSSASEHGVVLPLSPIDAAMGAFRFMTIHVYPPPSSDSSAPFDLERLHTSFQELIEQEYRIFLGELHVHPTTGVVSIRQSLETAKSGAARAIPFEQVQLGSSKDDVCTTTSDALENLSTDFVPARAKTQPITVRATLLSDGGLVLGVNISHSLLDGEGMFTFMKVWGEFYRSVPEAERTVVNHDRTLLASKGLSTGVQSPHPEYHVRASRTASTAAVSASVPLTTLPATSHHIFHLSPEQMKRIKALASGEPDLENNVEFVSTIDAISALFVLLITQARGHGQDVRFGTAVNARKRFSPPLPANYAGNAVFNAVTTYTADELASVSAEAVGRIARRVRQSITRFDDAFLRDAIEFVAASDNIADVFVSANFFFGPDIVLTSWANCGMYDADFGVHPLAVSAPKDLVRDGFLFIVEPTPGTDGLDVIVQQEAKTMERLLDLWGATLPVWS